MIGVVGGVGPYAGWDLCRKIFEQTASNTDQGHLPVVLISMPGSIADRTLFIQGDTDINPAHAISNIILKMEEMGATIIGIPCNTSHSPQIFNSICKDLENANSRVKILHLVDEVGYFIRRNYPGVKKVGILATNGTCKSGVYQSVLSKMGFEVLMPDIDLQESFIHRAIYDTEYGIKSQSNPVSEKAKKDLRKGIDHLRDRQADAIVLGCTEIPLAIADRMIGNTYIIDSTLVLARALIQEAAPDKLRPLAI